MDAILAHLRALQTFVANRTVNLDLNPDTDITMAMVNAYFRGIIHLRDAYKAFLTARELWQQLHEVA